MVTLNDLLVAIRDQLDQAFQVATDIAVHVEAGEFLAGEVPSVNVFPTGSVGLEAGTASFAETFGGIPIAIRVRVSPADIYAGQDLLFRFMDDVDALSVIAALDEDNTFGGTAQTSGWGDGWPWGPLNSYPDVNGDGNYLGSEMTLIALKAHS